MIQSVPPLKARKHAKGTGPPPAIALGERLGRHGPELPVPRLGAVRPCCPRHAPISREVPPVLARPEDCAMPP